MTEPATVLTVPVPVPVAPANLPVPLTIVSVISKNTGAFAPAADDPPGEIIPTMLSWITIVLPSSNVIVRTWQFGPHALKRMHWLATWPSLLIVALPHDIPAGGPPLPISTNVAWKDVVVAAIAGAASAGSATRAAVASASLNSFKVILPSVAAHPNPSA
jgi:hypothetical protein